MDPSDISTKRAFVSTAATLLDGVAGVAACAPVPTPAVRKAPEGLIPTVSLSHQEARSMHQPAIVLALIVLLALGSSASSAQVTVTDSVTGVTAELALPLGTSTLSKGKIAWAAFVSLEVGMGLGHLLIDQRHDGRVFRHTQLVGLGAAVVGLGMGFGGQESGQLLFYPGAALYLGSRVWEFLDIFASSATHNAKVAADRKALAAARQPRLGVLPVIGGARWGLALSVNF